MGAVIIANGKAAKGESASTLRLFLCVYVCATLKLVTKHQTAASVFHVIHSKQRSRKLDLLERTKFCLGWNFHAPVTPRNKFDSRIMNTGRKQRPKVLSTRRMYVTYLVEPLYAGNSKVWGACRYQGYFLIAKLKCPSGLYNILLSEVWVFEVG